MGMYPQEVLNSMKVLVALLMFVLSGCAEFTNYTKMANTLEDPVFAKRFVDVDESAIVFYYVLINPTKEHKEFRIKCWRDVPYHIQYDEESVGPNSWKLGSVRLPKHYGVNRYQCFARDMNKFNARWGEAVISLRDKDGNLIYQRVE